MEQVVGNPQNNNLNPYLPLNSDELPPLKKLIISGGMHKPNAANTDEWHRFSQAILLEIDVKSAASKTLVEYISPPEARPESDFSVTFKAGSLKKDRYYACTQTEVLVYSFPEFELLHYISLPCFNDLHHVCPTPQGTILVVSTGLDMVIEVTESGDVLRVWNVFQPSNPWYRFSQDIDYRKIHTTKPHASHPNFAFIAGNEIWATRFEQKDAVCLTNPEKRINIGLERAHDGIVVEDLIYFTTVNGHIAIANWRTCQLIETFNLNKFYDDDRRILGWCRGLVVLDSDHVLVGFSRLRPTKFRENVRWVQYNLGFRDNIGDMPSRIAIYNLRDKKIVSELNLEDLNVNEVYSIHVV